VLDRLRFCDFFGFRYRVEQSDLFSFVFQIAIFRSEDQIGSFGTRRTAAVSQRLASAFVSVMSVASRRFS
jgi:hypothetical protein